MKRVMLEYVIQEKNDGVAQRQTTFKSRWKQETGGDTRGTPKYSKEEIPGQPYALMRFCGISQLIRIQLR